MAMSPSSKGDTATGDRRRRCRRVLFFPLPYQGHINPMFQLAGLLHSRGFAITVFHTHLNAPDASLHPAYDFVPVPDGMPAAHQVTAESIIELNRACEAPFRERLAALLEQQQQHARDEEEDVACLVVDAHLLTMLEVARGLGVPTLVLRTASAACLRCFLAYPILHEKGYLPPQVPFGAEKIPDEAIKGMVPHSHSHRTRERKSKLYMPVKELPPLRVRDLYYSRTGDNDGVSKLLARASEAVKNSSGLVINTCDALEATDLERIRDELNIPQVLAVGPLHKLSFESMGSSLLNQDYGCIEWLDMQTSKSVLYVSFGSLASMDSMEFLEVAWGLANSGLPFLWVVRPDLVKGLDEPDFQNRFEAAVEGRGKLIQWAPQQEVLAHRAVGGFWTHCGWNSTLESIVEGIPMICRPCFADQMMNARYVEKTWGVGFELEGELERGKIDKAIRKLMKEREGDGMRERAKELKNKMEDCLKIGGSSHIAMDKMVNYLLSM